MRTNEGAHGPETGLNVAQPRAPREHGATATPPAEPPLSTFCVAGVLVHAPAPRTSEVAAEIARLPGAAVHGSASAKLAVTVEASDPAAILERIAEIQRLPGVTSAALISEHSAPLDTIDEELTND